MNKNILKEIVLTMILSFILVSTIPNVNSLNVSSNNINCNNRYYYLGILDNNPPIIKDPFPENGTDVNIDIDEVHIFIEDPDNDRINWSIETSPNIGTNLGELETSGGKICKISNLSYSKNYKWFVNVTDGKDWARKTYFFTTIDEPDYIPTVAKINIKVQPNKKVFIVLEPHLLKLELENGKKIV